MQCDFVAFMACCSICRFIKSNQKMIRVIDQEQNKVHQQLPLTFLANLSFRGGGIENVQDDSLHMCFGCSEEKPESAEVV